METLCPRCEVANPAVARFCRACGLSLALGLDGTRDAGRVGHPRPSVLPPGYQGCEGAADLFFQAESAWGGAALLATEGVKIVVFNRGYSLRDVQLQVVGQGEGDKRLFEIVHGLDDLPHGRNFAIEVPSYELPAPLRLLKVTLLSARYGRASD
jgi:hypothetical protein